MCNIIKESLDFNPDTDTIFEETVPLILRPLDPSGAEQRLCNLKPDLVWVRRQWIDSASQNGERECVIDSVVVMDVMVPWCVGPRDDRTGWPVGFSYKNPWRHLKSKEDGKRAKYAELVAMIGNVLERDAVRRHECVSNNAAQQRHQDVGGAVGEAAAGVAAARQRGEAPGGNRNEAAGVVSGGSDGVDGGVAAPPALPPSLNAGLRAQRSNNNISSNNNNNRVVVPKVELVPLIFSAAGGFATPDTLTALEKLCSQSAVSVAHRCISSIAKDNYSIMCARNRGVQEGGVEAKANGGGKQ